LQLANNYEGVHGGDCISPMRKAYIATAEALDEEMKERIENHKRKREDDWVTYEEPIKISDVLKTIEGRYHVVVIDCLTLWLSNLMRADLEVTNEISALLGALTNNPLESPHTPLWKRGAEGDFKEGLGGFSINPASTLFVVSNEVGMGIVPENDMARRFRDMAGFLNQRIAEIAGEVYMVMAGIPIKIK
jgi:adenosylcobinamide kinase/adenosylcobinamide-phosphate guanylyltransferase